MFPYLSIGALRVPMYGLMIVLGAALGVWTAMLRAERAGVKREDVLYCAVYAGVGAFIGAKLLYLLTPVGRYGLRAALASPTLLTSLFRQGYVFYGGLIGALIGVALYARRYHLRFWNLLDLLIVSVPLIHGFGRLGCFCAGCCWGRPAEPPWGLYFDASPVAPHGVALFPVQLVEALLNFVLFFLLLFFARKKRPPFHVCAAYLCAYAVQRFALEYLRADAARGILLGFSTSQWISLALIPAAALGVFLARRTESKTAEKSERSTEKPERSNRNVQN